MQQLDPVSEGIVDVAVRSAVCQFRCRNDRNAASAQACEQPFVVAADEGGMRFSRCAKLRIDTAKGLGFPQSGHYAIAPRRQLATKALNTIGNESCTKRTRRDPVRSKPGIVATRCACAEVTSCTSSAIGGSKRYGFA